MKKRNVFVLGLLWASVSRLEGGDPLHRQDVCRSERSAAFNLALIQIHGSEVSGLTGLVVGRDRILTLSGNIEANVYYKETAGQLSQVDPEFGFLVFHFSGAQLQVPDYSLALDIKPGTRLHTHDWKNPQIVRWHTVTEVTQKYVRVVPPLNARELITVFYTADERLVGIGARLSSAKTIALVARYLVLEEYFQERTPSGR